MLGEYVQGLPFGQLLTKYPALSSLARAGLWWIDTVSRGPSSCDHSKWCRQKDVWPKEYHLPGRCTRCTTPKFWDLRDATFRGSGKRSIPERILRLCPAKYL